MLNPSKEDEAAKIRRVTEEYFATINKPKDFSNNKNGYLIAQDHFFEDLVCVLEDNGTADAKGLTTYEFFKKTEYCERKYRTQIPK